MVRLNTVLGPVDIELHDTAAPLTVANFLSYVRGKAYDGMFFHRSVPGFVLQGGGYTFTEAGSARKVPAAAPVRNEFSPTRSNLRGTVAMAKIGGDPDSATSEWFVNLADNLFLDSQNGGFTVFGRLTAPGLATIDAFAAWQVVAASSTFSALPVRNPPKTGPYTRANLALVNSAIELPPKAQQSDADRIFTYLEAAYPQHLWPANAASASALGYYYRHYTGSNAYIGTAGGLVYYCLPEVGDEVLLLGTVAEWLAAAQAAGY
ncbi:MAG: peptidylprolyl isomerase [Burkholderiales bacterium]|nr:peptidylprolyl isomerase [Burkholderiales bacterium]